MEKNTFTLEDAIAMRGTEFVYEWPNGEQIKAYVKEFNPDIGMTFWTLEEKGSYGWKGQPGTEHDPDGTWCLVGVDLKKNPDSLEYCMEVLEEISKTGMRKPGESVLGFGTSTCSFS